MVENESGILDFINFSIPIFEINDQGRVLKINPAGSEYFGSEFIGKSVFIIFPDITVKKLAKISDRVFRKYDTVRNGRIFEFTFFKSARNDLI